MWVFGLHGQRNAAGADYIHMVQKVWHLLLFGGRRYLLLLGQAQDCTSENIKGKLKKKLKMITLMLL